MLDLRALLPLPQQDEGPLVERLPHGFDQMSNPDETVFANLDHLDFLMVEESSESPVFSDSNKSIDREEKADEELSLDALLYRFGRVRNSEEAIFTGALQDGVRHGRGRILLSHGWRQVTYDHGYIVRGGYAQMVWKGCRYAGFMSLNAQSFKPTSLIYPIEDQREWYRGTFDAELQPSGPGKMKLRNGKLLEGQFANGWLVDEARPNFHEQPFSSPLNNPLFEKGQEPFSLDLDDPYFENIEEWDFINAPDPILQKQDSSPDPATSSSTDPSTLAISSSEYLAFLASPSFEIPSTNQPESLSPFSNYTESN